MTVSSTALRADAVGNGATATFPFTFPVQSASELTVITRDLLGVETVLVHTTDYTVTLATSGEGGDVVLTAGNLTSGYAIAILPNEPTTQETDVRNQGAYFPDQAESDLDRGVIRDKQLQEQADRSLHLPASEAGAAAKTALPFDRASKWLAFGASKELVAAVGYPAASPTTAFGASLIDDPDAATARTTLGAGATGAALFAAATAAAARATLGTANRFAEAVNVLDSGATGLGVADDTAAIQTAINDASAAGGVVLFPPGTYKITDTLSIPSDGMTLAGVGRLSLIVQSHATKNAITASGRSGIRIADLRITPTIGQTSGDDGAAIYLLNCTRSRVSDVIVDYAAGGGHMGVTLRGCTYCRIDGNEFVNNPLVDGALDTTAGTDVFLNYGNSFNVITRNRCISSNAYGIQIVALQAADDASYNIVSHNTCVGAKAHGILIYRNNAAATMRHNQIVHNVVKDVTGKATNGFGTVYGIGIYVQAAEKTLVMGNELRNIGNALASQSLPLAAIGSSFGDSIIVGNDIDTSQWYGIWLSDSNRATDANGVAIVANNRIRSCTYDGIRLSYVRRVLVDANVISGVRYGIQHDSAVGDKDYSLTVTDNQIDTTTNDGIELAHLNQVVLKGNILRAIAGTGIYLDYVDRAQIEGNVILATTGGYGIDFTANCGAYLVVRNNQIDAPGAGYGIRANVAAWLDANVITNAATADSTGSFPLHRTLTNAATPSVAGAKLAFTGGTTGITAFTGGVDGQELVLYFNHNVTVTHGSGIVLQGAASQAFVADNILYLVAIGANWYERSRKT